MKINKLKWEELTEQFAKLNQLLAEPHFGLASWQLAYDNCRNKITELLKQKTDENEDSN